MAPRSIRARGALAAGAAALLAGCGPADAPREERRVSSDDVSVAAPTIAAVSIAADSVASAPAVRVDTVAQGLAVPWGIAFAPDGRAFVTERAGRVRVIEDGRLRAEPWATFDVYADEPQILPEAGLMGIALAPDFATSGHVYVVGTFWRGAAARSMSLPARLLRRAQALVGAPAERWENRVYRCTDRGGRAADCRAILTNVPASYYHAGGGLAFGPDGMLYVGVGDALDPSRTRAPGAIGAAILRVAPDGSVPTDNPVAGSPVYAVGFRNPQGLAWHPATGELLATDHGPTGMSHEGQRSGHDELNVVRAGADYGWPARSGADSAAALPLHLWRTAIAPGGLALHDGPAAAWRGSAFVTGLRGRTLRRLSLERSADGWRVTGEEALLGEEHGRLRAVAVAPDGALWVSTSNADGRGVPGPNGDLILRLVPAAAPALALAR